MINEAVLMKIAIIDMKGFMNFAEKYGQAKKAIDKYEAVLGGKIDYATAELSSPELERLERKNIAIHNAARSLCQLGSSHKLLGQLITEVINTPEKEEMLIMEVETIVDNNLSKKAL